VRGYDREEVDAAFSQLAGRLRHALDRSAGAEQARAQLQREITSLQQQSPSFEQVGGEAAGLLVEAGRTAEQLVENAQHRADTIIEKAQQQAEQLRVDVTAEAQKVLEQAREVAEQIRAEVEAERAAVVQETDQVREFRDGLLDDLGRVHGEITGLLERTFTERKRCWALAAPMRRRWPQPTPRPPSPRRSPRASSSPPVRQQRAKRSGVRAAAQRAS